VREELAKYLPLHPVLDNCIAGICNAKQLHDFDFEYYLGLKK